MDKVKLALLGCGDVAQRDYLPEFHRLADRAVLVAVCGRQRERAQAVATQYAIPQVYTDYAQMLEESGADALINLTPIQLHFETTAAALRAGKSVYCEKPVAGSVAEAKALQALATEENCTLVCAPSSLLFPQVRHARDLVTQGTIGELYSARAHGHMGVPPWHGYTSDPTPFFASGGGPARDMGVYPLHVLTGILGPAHRVSAMISHVLDDFVPVDGPMSGQRIAVEAPDNWQMVLDFGGGRLATLAANNVVVASRAPQVELHGLRGTIAFDPIDVSTAVEIYRHGPGWETTLPPFPGQPAGRERGPDHHLGVEHLVDCLIKDWRPQLSIEHALHVIEIIEKATQAAQTGVTQHIENRF